MFRKYLLASCVSVLFIASCASSGGGSGGRYNTQNLRFGQLTAAPFDIDNDPLARIDLMSLIDPENRRAMLISEGLCDVNNATPLGVRGNANPSLYADVLDEGTRSITQLRRDYLVQRYKNVVEQLVTESDGANRKALLKEKEALEKEAADLGAELDPNDGNVNPSIELNCAMFAFHSYYLSYPQFQFAINDLSSLMDLSYLGSTGSSFPYIQDFGASEFDEYAAELKKGKKAVEALSDYERARLKAYLSAGLYDQFYNQAARSIAISMRRNAVQDQIMVHSENYCRYFKARLHDTDIQVNMTLGVLATTLGGLATIFTDPTTVRALAGSAAIVSGGQSRFNEVMFANLAVQTVIAGIDVARENVLRDINKKRFYPLDEKEQESFDSGGVLNPGMFNTYGIRASIEWEGLYSEKNGKLAYAGVEVLDPKGKLDNSGYDLPIFSMSDLLERTGQAEPLRQEAAWYDEEQTDSDQTTDDEQAEDDAQTQEQQTDSKPPIKETPPQDPKNPPPPANNGAAKKYLGISSVSIYGVEAALRDAIRFQTECSLASGLTAATESLKEVQAPSVETLTRSLEQMTDMMKATEDLKRALDRASDPRSAPLVED